MERCARDVVYFANEFCWTYDPRETVSTLPFLLFDKQIEFLRWLQDCESKEADGVAEKCRDVGFTWLCCVYAIHAWLFRPGFRCGFGSRKLELVDKIGDPACIFEKMRFIIDNLPRWMRPTDYSTGYCKILNLDNGASISGEGGDEIGRGDRTTMYFVDEAAFLERSQRVDAALSQTSRCKIWVSTPNGQGNSFYKKRMSGQYPVFTFGWQDDPRKGEAWYEKQKAMLDPVTLAQEVDIDYSASIEGICIPAKWVRAAVDLVQRVELPQGGPLIAAYDIAAEGKDKNVLGFRRGCVVQEPIISWGEQNTTASAHKAREEAERAGAKHMNYDAGGNYGESIAALGRDGVLNFTIRGLQGGEAPSENLWPDGRTSKEKFSNGRAEWWSIIRERFRKAYEYSEWLNDNEDGTEHPLEELISIPNDADLIRDLSLPLVEITATGKVQIESKIKMAGRGVKSPDFADMLAYLFAPSNEPMIIENAIR